MSIRRAGFARRSKALTQIPGCSLADIAFLLLIFFMVSTAFRRETERPIEWPTAAATQQIDEKHDDIMYVWVERTGEVFINDLSVPMEEVAALIEPLSAASGSSLTISLRADARVPYIFIDQLQTQLKRAGTRRVVFATDLERRMATN